MNGCVYGIFFPALRRVYVGCSTEPTPIKRWWNHLRGMRAGTSHCVNLRWAFQQTGERGIVWRVLEYVDGDLGDLQAAEQRWVNHYADRRQLLNTRRSVALAVPRRSA